MSSLYGIPQKSQVSQMISGKEISPPAGMPMQAGTTALPLSIGVAPGGGDQGLAQVGQALIGVLSQVLDSIVALLSNLVGGGMPNQGPQVSTGEAKSSSGGSFLSSLRDVVSGLFSGSSKSEKSEESSGSTFSKIIDGIGSFFSGGSSGGSFLRSVGSFFKGLF